MTLPQLNISSDNKRTNVLKKIDISSTPQGKLLTIVLVLSLVFLFLFLSQSLSREQTKQQLHVEIIPSLIKEKTIAQLLLTKEPYQLIKNNYVNLGKKNHLWLKLTITDKSAESTQIEHLILVLKKNRIHTPIELHYLAKNKTWQQQLIQGNPQFRHNIVARLPNDMLSNSLYLKLQGRYLRTSLFVFNNDEFFEDIQYTTLFSGLFFGMLVLFSVYHLMLYVRLKKASYLAYSSMLFLLGFWFLSGQGWLDYLLPNMRYLHNKTVFIGALLVVSIAEFAKHYLQIKTFSKSLHRGLCTAQLLLSLLAITRLFFATFLPEQVNQVGYVIGLLMSFIIFVSCFSAAILAVKKNISAAWYYLTATVMFFVIAIIMGLSAGNIINFNFSWYLLQVTSAIEIIIFSAGLVSIYYQQEMKEQKIALQLKETQSNLVKQLEISNSLKDKILNNVVDHKLFPELAKVTHFLSDIIYVQALGNDCLVVYKKNNRSTKIELACNLQNLQDSFGDEYFMRVHKSYMINPQQSMLLQRRSSADYDINMANALIPVGRKHLNQVKALI